MDGNAGKNMTPKKGYSRKAYADHYDLAFPPRRTSQEWCDLLGVFVIEATGWRDDPHAWGKRILETEFTERLNRSTMMHRVDEPKSPNA